MAKVDPRDMLNNFCFLRDSSTNAYMSRDVNSGDATATMCHDKTTASNISLKHATTLVCSITGCSPEKQVVQVVGNFLSSFSVVLLVCDIIVKYLFLTLDFIFARLDSGMNASVEKQCFPTMYECSQLNWKLLSMPLVHIIEDLVSIK